MTPSSRTPALRRVGIEARLTPVHAAAAAATTISRPGGEDEQVGQPGAEHAPASPDTVAARTSEPPRPSAAVGRRPGPAAAPAAGPLAGEGDDGRRHHRGQERARGHGAAQLLDHDGQLGQAVAAAAPPTRAGAGRASRAGELVPERRQGLVGGVEQGPGGARASALARNARATDSSSRWASVMAMGMARLPCSPCSGRGTW